MTTWILTCPNCGNNNEIPKQVVVVRCGIVHCHCACKNCRHEFDGQQDYWQWLGLTEEPPAELNSDIV